MPAPERVVKLVENFKRNLEDYKSGKYNETQVRREYIDPFWKALGWDIDNEAGHAEAYKDVIHEDKVKVKTGVKDGEATKAPDYSFRVGKERKFFLEAKKPSIYLKEDIGPAYQLRRYGWSAGLALSVLTDFEELAIYDCRQRPKTNDKATTSRLLYFTFDQYLEKWEEISGIFSKDAVLKGSFDKYLETNKIKKGSDRVDEAFLDEIEHWRDLLAHQFANQNKFEKTNDLNTAVQVTIDRIIFLRICEDRGIERYGHLGEIGKREGIYKELLKLFQQADLRYNSGLFHFEKEEGRSTPADTITPKLKIDDKPLKEILAHLYYPESPYEFSVMPADILGSVYERFLGKVIRLTESGRAKVEEKPEVRKAGGVYYTPKYIVDYIVKNTVGKLVEGKTPKEVSELKILDPACGSGSFLIGAYQHLLDWHLAWYIANDPEKWMKGKNPTLRPGTILFLNSDNPKQAVEWRLTTSEKKRILLNNIHGVDLDEQAVEVTKLSLLLKVLEDESSESVHGQQMLSTEHVLPDLGDNIKCGNSLIGSDYYKDKQVSMIEEEEVEKIKVFDWDGKDGFPEIMKSGGFDAVIGNPPYVRQELLGDSKEYFESSYKVYQGTADLYSYFIEKGVSLIRKNGLFSIIVANKWMRANYGEPLRTWLKTQGIVEIIDFGDLPVFETATTYPCILTIEKERAEEKFFVTQIKTLEFNDLSEHVSNSQYSVDRHSLSIEGWSLSDEVTEKLMSKLKSSGVPLSEYVKGEIYRGVLTGLNEAFVIDLSTKKRLISEDPKSKEIIKPFLAGRDVKRYQEPVSEKWLIFTRHGINIKEYPAVEKHLSQFKKNLMPKPKNWTGKEWEGRKPGSYQWYEIQDTVDYFKEFEKPKIIVPAIVQRASYAFDTEGFYSNDKTSIIPTNDLYLLGVLGSKAVDFVMHAISSTKQGGYFEYKPIYLSQLPIRQVDPSNEAEKNIHAKVVSLVQRMLSLNKEIASVEDDSRKKLIQNQIDATDREIDALVYQLYGLTEEEIKVVEGAG